MPEIKSVLAIFDGQVIEVGEDKLVVQKAGSIQKAYYYHVETITVAVGDEVQNGQELGTTTLNLHVSVE